MPFDVPYNNAHQTSRVPYCLNGSTPAPYMHMLHLTAPKVDLCSWTTAYQLERDQSALL